MLHSTGRGHPAYTGHENVEKLEVDLFSAALKKMDLNETKYPAERVRGSAKKYTEYD
jgi:hypothetical protein